MTFSIRRLFLMTETNKSSNIQSLASDLAVVRDFLDRAEPPEELSEFERKTLLDQIKNLLLEKNAKLVAHYYTDSLLQDLAEETRGFVGDSLEMARFGRECDAEVLVVAGVRFMLSLIHI